MAWRIGGASPISGWLTGTRPEVAGYGSAQQANVAFLVDLDVLRRSADRQRQLLFGAGLGKKHADHRTVIIDLGDGVAFGADLVDVGQELVEAHTQMFGDSALSRWVSLSGVGEVALDVGLASDRLDQQLVQQIAVAER